ncbi:hypothetical protein V6N13_029346 [Hibiscus sabdariffa]|uniref:EF-hand domain-containing protein n=2 Tax=Hibiscus sabdariffa TaxID=183260 RepID=A0ABR2BXB0_9ROSI
MQKLLSLSLSSSNKMIPLWGIMVFLVFLNFAIILHDFYSSFCFTIGIFKSLLGIIPFIRVSSSPATTEKICRHGETTLNAPAQDERTTEDEHVEAMAGIEGLFEEEEPSLMEVKEAFDVFDENKDGFIDAKELRNALFSWGFIKEVSEDDCQRMIKGFDHNFDGRIDFNEFVKVLDTSFYSSN